MTRCFPLLVVAIELSPIDVPVEITLHIVVLSLHLLVVGIFYITLHYRVT